MSDTTRTAWTTRQWLAIAVLAGIALSGNVFAPRMFTGFNYLFGSVGVMITLRFFGIVPALLTALLAAAWCKQLFGHYYPLIWLGLEPLFVWIWIRNRPKDSLIIADAVYWIVVGSPLILIVFLGILQVAPLGTAAAALMYSTIGIINTLLANIFADMPCIQHLVWPQYPFKKPTIAQLLFKVLMLAIALPAVFILAIAGRAREEVVQEKMLDQLDLKARQVGYEIRQKIYHGSYPTVFDNTERDKLDRTAVLKVLQEIRQKQQLELYLMANQGEVLASTNPAIGAASTYDPLHIGRITSTDHKLIFRRAPGDKQAIPLWQRASKTVFIRIYPIPNTPVYSIAEISFAPFQAQILRGHRNALAGLLLYISIGAILATVVARSIANPIIKLSQTTTDLPGKLFSEDLSWPSSTIAEIHQLVENAQDMAHTLSNQFKEIAQINTDLEERVASRTKQLSDANRELKDEILQRITAQQERDRLFKELENKNKELESIIYVASHDLRSPLVNIQGFGRKLEKNCATLQQLINDLPISDDSRPALTQLLSEAMPRSLGFVTGSAEKMDSLLSGLLRLSRLGRSALTIENLDMNRVMGKIADSVAYQLEASGARLLIEPLLPCLGDEIQVSQVFTNLLDNAVKYRSSNRSLEIRITCRACADSVEYRVQDNGIGIHPDYQEQVWEIFHRINPRDIPGEGLGLTVSRRIMDRLNGTIRLESEDGTGSCFYVCLPATRI